ncbi:MAG: beta-propeller domain-containing protein [Lachnospiraceae bacterium]|nr:beta-propeller domain-containing protein [Lachnospiraceae bacterium]
MNEQEMLRQLREAAKEMPVPDAIKPDQMENMLKDKQTGKKQKRGRIMRFSRWMAAAALLLVCGIGVYAVAGISFSSKSADMSNECAMDMAESTAGEKGAEAAEEGVNVAALGDVYTQAVSYDEIYERLSELKKEEENQKYNMVDNPDAMLGLSQNIQNGMEEAVAEDSSVAFGSSYSTTNLQTEGVDEGDIMKTDGHYIYRILGDEGRLVITDASGEEPVEAASLCPTGLQPDDVLKELYVAGDRLVLLAQRRETSLSNVYEDSEIEDIYYFDDVCKTIMVTLDISDPTHPREVGMYQQDGSYQTSRRVGDVMYLFTEKYNMNQNIRENDDASDVFPKIQGEVIPCDDIYLAESYNEALVISSVDLNDPEQTVDAKMILDYGSRIYVGENTAYLYKYSYHEGSYTDIAAFTLKNGIIVPVNAYSVPGDVMDTFAISEKDGYLRVLTTNWTANQGIDSEPENALYVLDSGMKLCGKLTGIAPGESIYAARFIGDMGYFVTYRNTDPLFSVDLSDPRNPRLVGELSVTGFSDYLHVWDANHLLGIGYETDPNTGQRLGLKLSMFNISDPSNVYEEGKCILKQVDYTPALEDYKSVLVSADKNIIGLMLFDYDQMNEGLYTVFSYENGSFTPKQELELKEGGYIQSEYDYIWNTCRSLYIDDRIYVMDGADLSVIDM